MNLVRIWVRLSLIPVYRFYMRPRLSFASHLTLWQFDTLSGLRFACDIEGFVCEARAVERSDERGGPHRADRPLLVGYAVGRKAQALDLMRDYEAFSPQITMRFSGARYMVSPSVTPRASYMVSKPSR